MRFWKPLESYCKYYTFDEALAIVTNKQNPAVYGMRIKAHYNNDNVYTREDFPKNPDMIELPVWMIRSDKWEIVEPDYEMEAQVDEIADWISNLPGYHLDTRFYKPGKMNLTDWWKQLYENFISKKPELLYKMMSWIKNNYKPEEIVDNAKQNEC